MVRWLPAGAAAVVQRPGSWVVEAVPGLLGEDLAFTIIKIFIEPTEPPPLCGEEASEVVEVHKHRSAGSCVTGSREKVLKKILQCCVVLNTCDIWTLGFGG